MRAAFAERWARGQNASPAAQISSHLRLCQGKDVETLRPGVIAGRWDWPANPLRQLRWLTSAALMLSPALLAQLWLAGLLERQSPVVNERAAVRQLAVQRHRLAAWLVAADQGLSASQLSAQLNGIQGQLAAVAPHQCGLPIQQELNHLAGRLNQQLGPASLPSSPVWQRRYGAQVEAAGQNLEQCRASI